MAARTMRRRENRFRTLKKVFEKSTIWGEEGRGRGTGIVPHAAACSDITRLLYILSLTWQLKATFLVSRKANTKAARSGLGSSNFRRAWRGTRVSAAAASNGAV